MYFDNPFLTFPFTCYCIVTFNLGMQNGVILAAQPYGLGLNETLMPQYFKELGYATHGVGKVWQLYPLTLSNSEHNISA